MSESEGIKIPLSLDITQALADLKTLDTESERIQRKIVAGYNASDVVRQKRAPRADNLGDVRAQLSGLSGTDLRSVLLQIQRPMQQLAQRTDHLERTARAGGTSIPPTQVQAQRMAAQQRLSQQAQANQKPIQIEGTARFYARLASVSAKSGPALDMYRLAGGRVPAAARTASNLMSPLIEMAATNPAMAAAMTAAMTAVGGGLYVNAGQTAFARTQATLASSLVGGPLLGTQRNIMGLNIADVGNAMSIGKTEAQQLAQTLAGAGTNRTDLVNNLRNVAMLGGPNQLPYQDVAALAAQLGTQGGLSSAGINKTFQEMQLTAHGAGISLTELLASMKALSTSAIGAARDVGGLSAVQHFIGATSGVSSGQFFSPVLGATGIQALQASALLGMTPQQLLQAQSTRGGTAQLYDRIAGLVRRVDHGAAGTDVAESLLSSSGLVDMSNISPSRLAGLIEKMRTAPAGQAAQYARQLYTAADKQVVSPDQAVRRAAQAIGDMTPAVDRLHNAFDNFMLHGLIGVAPTGGSRATTSTGSHAYGPTGTGEVGSPSNSSPSANLRTNPNGQSGIPPISGSMDIPNGLGHTNRVLPYQMAWYQRGASVLAQGTGVSYEKALSILLAQGSAESGFNANARSAAGAEGIAQFLPSTAKQYGLTNPFDAQKAIIAQARMDADNFKRTGNWQAALGAYNPGDPTYGPQVYGAAQQTEQQVHVDISVHDDRTTTRVTQTRPVSGAKTHGPTSPRHR
jgi:hypothetical protein